MIEAPAIKLTQRGISLKLLDMAERGETALTPHTRPDTGGGRSK